MTIGIMGAMPEEVESLLRDPAFCQASSETVGERVFYRGMFAGTEIVLVFSRWGKVAAASTAGLLIERFGASEVWFTGVAGALDPALRIGDVVIAGRLIQHDLDPRPLFGRFEIPLSERTFLETSTEVRSRLLAAAEAFVAGDYARAVSAASRDRFSLHGPKVVVGDVATGDQFIAGADEVKRLREMLPLCVCVCVCVEMEGAAVAQVCAERGVPFGVVRVISDSADHAAPIDFPRFVAEVASVYTDRIVGRALAMRG